MINKTSLTFEDISSEIYRVYVFPDHSEVRINDPDQIAVRASGAHMILDLNNVSHYIPTGWNHLYWEVRIGAPNFVK